MSDPVLLATSSFLGREAELAEGAQLLCKPRLLTVTGPGGAGKTRYVLELARRAEPDFGDGLFTCLFAPLRDPALVLPTIAQTFAIREEPGRSALESLAAHLEGRHALLLLDNLEHLPASREDLADLVEDCPGLTLLCTSRERLRLDGELVYELPPMGESDAVSLFCERAQTEPSETIRELCRRLEGLPLAIELAAARLSVLSPEQLLERLSRRLDLLKGPRDADPRQQTLRATIAWSYGLLSDEERRAFRALSVFRGGCIPEAAEEVAGADRDTTLASLVDKSLLRYADARYAMLETVREFAEERLEESGDGDAAQQRHAESMVARAAPVAEAFERGENRLDALAPDWDDLRAALAFLEETGQTDLGLQLIGSTWPLWYMRGASLEGRRWAVGPLARSEGERSARRARALLAASVFAAAIGDFEHAEDFAIESLAIQHELGETRTRPPLLTNLGIIAHQRGDFVAAERLYAESAREAHATQNGFQRAVALENLAELAMRDGDYARAGELSDEAMALFDDLDSDWGRAWSLIDRAYCLHGAGREDEAIVAASRSLVLARGIRAASALWPGAVLVAAVAAKQGEPEIALGVIRAADVLSRSTPEVVPVGIQSELYRETVDELRRALGPERYDASSAEQTMSPEGATQEILDSAARLSGEPASHG